MKHPNNCICCNKELETTLNDDKSIMFVDGGTHQEITIGYGSYKHDGETLEFSICDTCITEKTKAGNMFLKGNFFEGLSKLPKGTVVTSEDQKEINRDIFSHSFKFV